MPLEVFTILGSSAVGFLFKFIARRAEARDKQFEYAIKGKEFADNSADRAAQRANDTGGKITRRFIVTSIIFSTVVMSALVVFLDIPLFVHEKVDVPVLFGLLGNKVQHVIIEVNGFLVMPEIRHALLVIVGYYFGQGAAK